LCSVQIVALTLDSSRAQPADAESVRGATLIVCPLAVLDQWEREFGKHCKPDSLSVYKYHGTQRTKSASKLSAFDVVLTTYATITSELRNETKDDGLLHQIKWHRIVIDEGTTVELLIFDSLLLLSTYLCCSGHQIKNHLSKTAKAIFALNASRRWFVSGSNFQQFYLFMSEVYLVFFLFSNSTTKWRRRFVFGLQILAI
jgi:SNF2 family DNA or RNA helicase